MSNCEVCIADDFGDEFYRVAKMENRTARKPHECHECGQPIAIGAKYEHFWGTAADSGSDTFDTCALCVEVRNVFTCGLGWVFGNLWKSMEEHAFPVLTTATNCFRQLSPEAKEYVLQRWRKWKGLPT